MMLFIRPISGKIFDKNGHKMLIYIAGICGIIGLLILGATNNQLLLLIAAVFYGIAYGTIHPTVQSWAVSVVETNKRGTANVMILTCMDLGMAVGAPALGMIADQFGYRVMYRYTSVCFVILLVMYMINSIRSKNLKTIEGKQSDLQQTIK
jgi:MFS family permease